MMDLAKVGSIALAFTTSCAGCLLPSHVTAQETNCVSMVSDMIDRLEREPGWYAGHYTRVKDRGAATHDSTATVTVVRNPRSGALVAERFKDQHASRTDETSIILHDGSDRVDVILHSWGNTRLQGKTRYCRYQPNQDYDVGGQADDDVMLIFGTYEEGNGQSFFTMALSRMGPAG